MTTNTGKPELLLKVDESKTMSERLINGAVGVIIGLAGAVVSTFFVSRDFKETFGPTLIWIIAPVGLGLIFYIFAGRHKFSLYKEGVSVKTGMRSYLYHWDSFVNFTADDARKKFQLKRKLGGLSLTSREHFDDVKKILSEYIHIRE